MYGYRWLEVKDEKIRIVGTRIRVEDVLGLLEAGYDVKGVAKEYDVPEEAVREAIRFAKDLVSLERWISLNEAEETKRWRYIFDELLGLAGEVDKEVAVLIDEWGEIEAIAFRAAELRKEDIEHIEEILKKAGLEQDSYYIQGCDTMAEVIIPNYDGILEEGKED